MEKEPEKKKEEKKVISQPKTIHEQMGDIIKEYGQVSNIPVNHLFWGLKNQLLKNKSSGKG